MFPDVSKESIAFILNNQFDREQERRRNKKKLFWVHSTLENAVRPSAASGTSHLTTQRHISERQNPPHTIKLYRGSGATAPAIPNSALHGSDCELNASDALHRGIKPLSTP